MVQWERAPSDSIRESLLTLVHVPRFMYCNGMDFFSLNPAEGYEATVKTVLGQVKSSIEVLFMYAIII